MNISLVNEPSKITLRNTILVNCKQNRTYLVDKFSRHSSCITIGQGRNCRFVTVLDSEPVRAVSEVDEVHVCLHTLFAHPVMCLSVTQSPTAIQVGELPFMPSFYTSIRLKYSRTFCTYIK